VPGPPQGWTGPIAFWEGMTSTGGAPPNCPVGYDSEPPVDLNRDLNAPTPDCTCTCSAQGQVCGANTVLHIYPDRTCTNQECAAATAKTCDAVSSGSCGSQGSVRGAVAGPTGGACVATPSKIPPPTWNRKARLCATNNAGSCEDPNQVCAPTPHQPYNSALCVTSIISENATVPPCPVEYPTPIAQLYASYADGRGCTECTCGSVSGGSCPGRLTITSGGDCSSGTSFVYDLGQGCQWYDLGPGAGVQPTHVGAQYTLVAGSCAAPTQPVPTMGKAVPNGQVTVVCCK
jgi:hypothetical protein